MKLKVKTLLVVGITMFLFLTLLFIFIRPFLLEDSIELDRNNSLKDLDRVQNYLKSNMDNLNRTNRDWAVWDDSYSFLTGKNPDFPKASLQNGTFENNEVNFMLYINNQNQVIFQKAYDFKKHQQLSINSDFYKVYLPLLDSPNIGESPRLVTTDLGLAISSIQPVYRTNGQGPSPGTLIMGRLINNGSILELGEELQLSLSLHQTDQRHFSLQHVVKPISETEMEGSLYLQDYAKKKAYEIRLINKRNFYLQKLANVKQLTFYLILTSLFFIVLTIFLLNKYILSRVRELSSQLFTIQNKKDINSRISISNGPKDELTDLQHSINQMLSSLEEKHSEVINLAYYDQLTQLPNRYFLFQEFTSRLQQNQSKMAVLFLDLDGFKRVNDSLGHKVGDALLKSVCARVLPMINEKNGVIARFGGDEFVILLKYESIAELENLSGEILFQVGQEYQIPPFKTVVTASIGISMYPHDGETIEQLLQSADIAMYEAKRKGKNQYFFFQDLAEDSSYKNLLELENDLKFALQKDQLELNYQTIVCGADKSILGVEALLRWNHPGKGMIPPGKFIPIAEETGVMPAIGLWVLEESVKQVSKWYQAGWNQLTLSVNISKSQMKDRGLIEKLDQVMKDYAFPPSMLQIEITESDIHHYLDEVLQFTKDLKKRNVKIALDDFGVGNSSLLYLKELPIDVIKIDRNFIKNVPAQPFDTILLSGIFEIIKGLDLEVIVEGIETEEQIRYVTTRIRTKLQGFYFSRPLPSSKLEKEFLGLGFGKNEEIGQLGN
ncbi:EAL domain-containing protein [Neobacillus cucumis]|uniref:EAL domain-containing protein n=1 Tax=Neobacillus cucumis TaxID=1740721 RepID=UPI0018DF88A0|nr:EAL domain-containing protein [Neobacillus cucumis]MBI0580330.1 EAL domain-containing protein [Neobacillus cucumis]